MQPTILLVSTTQYSCNNYLLLTNSVVVHGKWSLVPGPWSPVHLHPRLCAKAPLGPSPMLKPVSSERPGLNWSMEKNGEQSERFIRDVGSATSTRVPRLLTGCLVFCYLLSYEGTPIKSLPLARLVA